MRPGKVIPINTPHKRADAEYLLDAGRTIALKYLPTLLQRMLDNADDVLFELADKAENNQEQNSYFDAMRELRLARAELEQGFREQLKHTFTNFISAPTTPAEATETESEPASDEMSLVDELDLEESLAVNGMSAKVKSRYPRELYAIEQRFQAVTGRRTPAEQIPIGAQAICRAFQAAVNTLDSDIKIKLIIYKLFDKHVLANLQPLYDETNVLLISAGVLPKLKMQVNKQTDSDHPPSRRKAPPDDTAWLDHSTVSPTQSWLDDGAGYREASTLETLRDLLSQQHTGDNHPVARHRDGNVPDNNPAELIAALSNLQQLNVATSTETFQAQLDALRHNGQLSSIDNDIINIVDMLFEFILDDEHIPSAARALLARLQIPMIKVALVDRNFFGSKQHPAKKLLNLMAKAALGLSNEVDADNCPLIAKIDTVVHRICSDFNDDLTLFSELLAEFEQFLDDEDKREQQAREASRARSHEREQHALSRAWVTDVIAVAIDNRKLPKAVFELLDGPWKEVMIHTYLNDGRDSRQWKENLRFIDLLIWSVENHDGDRQRLGRIIPELIRTLRDEVAQISFPPAKLEALLAELEALHLARVRGKAGAVHKTVKVKAEPATDRHAEDTTAAISRELDAMRRELSEIGDVDSLMDELLSGINSDNEPSRKQAMAAEFFDEEVEEIVMSSAFVNDKTLPEIDDHYWTMVQQLQTGQWIVLTDSKGRQQKIKLSWKSDMLGECTFINWKFKVAADLTFNQLAARFRAGEARLIDNLPVFERAVDAVVNSLQRRQS